MTRPRPALPLLATVALAACNLAPKYVRPDMPVPPTLPSGQGDGPAYPPAVAGAAQPADIAWRDFFTDPKLRRLVEIALVNNRDLRVLVANVAQARAQFRSERADLFPNVAATGSANYQKQSSGQFQGFGIAPGTPGAPSPPRRIDIYQAQIGISAWEIDLLGRQRNLTREAFEKYLASQEARNAAQVSLIAEVATGYLRLAADRDLLRVAQETAASNLSTLQLTQAQFRIGTQSELEVRQAQTSYDTARAQVQSQTTQVAQDLNALNLLLGAPAPADLLPAGLPRDGATIAALPASLSSEVLLRRPDIAEAEHNLLAANADIGAARAAFFPTISLTAALGTLSVGLSGLFAGGNGTWQVQPQISQTIFDFGKNQANLRYSRASRDVAVAQYEKAIQTGFREVADALARRGTIRRQLEAQESLQQAAAATLKLSEVRFRAGVDTFLNVLDAQRTLSTANQRLVTTRLTEQSNMVELYRSLGGGLR